MTDILNLDELSNVVKQFTYQGKTYDICEISLGDFIQLTAEQKRLEAQEKKGTITEEDMAASYRANIRRMVPGITDEVINSMTMRQLKALLDFINTAAIDQQVVNEAEEQAKK